MPHARNNPILIKKTAELGHTSRSLIIFIAFGILFIGAVAVAIYFYLQYQQTQSQLSKTTQANEQAALVQEVGKLIMLPTGEQPQIATVSDISKLKGQSFFVNAHNGDKVLIYQKAKKAILFDPQADKIIEVGPISFSQVTQGAAQVAGAAVTVTPVRVAVYNGTPTVGYATQIAQELTQKAPAVTVVAKADTKGSYTSTIVADLSGTHASQAAALATLLKGKVGPLPKGETKPTNAEVLVILGK